MTSLTNQQLISKAYEAMKYSYSPYSNFKVGAALFTEDGYIYSGCNIENASYGATICAERNAIFKAVSEGHTKIAKIAIVSKTRKYTYPCGMCRQVMSEFMDKDGIILISDDEDGMKEYTLDEMLPYCFEL